MLQCGFFDLFNKLRCVEARQTVNSHTRSLITVLFFLKRGKVFCELMDIAFQPRQDKTRSK